MTQIPVLWAVALLSAPLSQDVEVPDGFEVTSLARGLNGGTALTISPDGRIFVCEQTGTLRVVKGGKLLPEPLLALKVDSYWERGLIGVTLHPEFPLRPFVYVTYVSPTPFPHHRISRFTARGDRAVPGSEVVFIKGDNQEKMGGSYKAGHQGGALHFGKDGKLYVSIGEQTAGKPAQDLGSLLGKILRFNADGSIPEDNPFFNQTRGKYRAIWARGLRNPYCFAIQPGTGRMFINDVGGSQWEEINEGFAGKNYGWPHVEGPDRKKKARKFVDPFYAYRHTEGKSIAGGVFYNPASASFPTGYHGKYFFIDYMGNWIKTIDPGNSKNVRLFASRLTRPADLRVAPDGSLVVLNRNMWVKDKKFKANTSSLLRIRYTGKKRTGRASAAAVSEPKLPPSVNLPGSPQGDAPRLLSKTGVFRSVTSLAPAAGFVPYDVNSPQWADGAVKRRWIGLPEGAKIGFAPTGPWRIPAGTVLVEHLELALDAKRTKRLETRILVAGDGDGFGLAYRWNEGGTDAELVTDYDSEDFEVRTPEGKEERFWIYHSGPDCRSCHGPNAGFVLGLNTRQVNRAFALPGKNPENQLLAWSALGMFANPPAKRKIGDLERLAPPLHDGAPLEARVRSYLDANCAGCHRPGGARASFDARFETPLDAAGILDGKLQTGNLEIENARVVAPGDPHRSILLQRMQRLDTFRMPPLGRYHPDREGARLIREWIESLSGPK